jgi:hypothetical protein
MQAEPVDQRLLDFLMQQQKAIGVNNAATEPAILILQFYHGGCDGG